MYRVVPYCRDNGGDSDPPGVSTELVTPSSLWHIKNSYLRFSVIPKMDVTDAHKDKERKNSINMNLTSMVQNYFRIDVDVRCTPPKSTVRCSREFVHSPGNLLRSRIETQKSNFKVCPFTRDDTGFKETMSQYSSLLLVTKISNKKLNSKPIKDNLLINCIRIYSGT